jgi:hypothetical protein
VVLVEDVDEDGEEDKDGDADDDADHDLLVAHGVGFAGDEEQAAHMLEGMEIGVGETGAREEMKAGYWCVHRGLRRLCVVWSNGEMEWTQGVGVQGQCFGRDGFRAERG